MTSRNRVIVSNQVECLVCGDRPFSAYRHDFKYCECGATAVDGGCFYRRRLGENYKDISITVDRESLDIVIKEAQDMIDTGRNARGVVYGVLRAIRDTKMYEDFV